MVPHHRGGSGGRGRQASGSSPSPYPLGCNTTVLPSTHQGPVLSGRKKLIVAKLAEEDVERQVKGDAKKEKHLIEEKGHVEPSNFLDSRERFLIGIATKGVVKLFYDVNKAQNAQRGLNPSRFKDVKALTKRSKEAFFSELTRAPGQSVEETTKFRRPLFSLRFRRPSGVKGCLGATEQSDT